MLRVATNAAKLAVGSAVAAVVVSGIVVGTSIAVAVELRERVKRNLP